MITLLFLFTTLLGCAEEKMSFIPGSTARISEPVPEKGAKVELQIFHNAQVCEDFISQLKPDNLATELAACQPWFDRANGEMRLSFAVRADLDNYLTLPELGPEHLKIGHGPVGAEVEISPSQGDVIEIIPHEPLQVGQLFVLLIDGSSSMLKDINGERASESGGKSRMELVKEALLLSDVQDAFLPKNGQNGVQLFVFTKGKPKALHKGIITDAKEYRQTIKSNLEAAQGYTHLYGAMEWAFEKHLKSKKIEKWLSLNDAQPTLVLLTDGFNNERASDKCGDNADRLEKLLEKMASARTGSGADLLTRPTVYTVGLGKKIQSKFELPSNRLEVTKKSLCSKKFMGQTIDNNLENKGIDNPSLAWIADVGGGQSYVGRNKSKLGKAFSEAAAKRYRWFEVRYKTNPLRMRRGFQTQLQLTAYSQTNSTIAVHPNAWLDAPRGKTLKDGKWSEAQSFWHATSFLLPSLGVLLFLSILGSAYYNISRFIWGRMRPPKPPRSPPSVGA